MTNEELISEIDALFHILTGVEYALNMPRDDELRTGPLTCGLCAIREKIKQLVNDDDKTILR